jgi:hypothetical protein
MRAIDNGSRELLNSRWLRISFASALGLHEGSLDQNPYHFNG